MANKMRLQEFKDVKREERDATSLERLYSYWYESLFNKIVRMFEWTGLPFPQHELEKCVMLNGIGFAAYHDDVVGIITGAGSLYGVTRYSDIYTHVVYAMPDEEGKSISGKRKLGSKAVALYNTSLSMGMNDFIARYASLLAHADLSLKCAFVNGRMQDVLVAASSSARASMEEYYASKYVGEPKAILDESLIAIEGGTVNLSAHNPVPDYMAIIEAQNEIQRSFFRDIGIRWTREKRGNMTEDEVNNDEQMLLFNISDMLHCRLRFCEEYNRIFADKAKSISVKLSPEYSIIGESEIEEEERKDNGQEDDT